VVGGVVDAIAGLLSTGGAVRCCGGCSATRHPVSGKPVRADSAAVYGTEGLRGRSLTGAFRKLCYLRASGEPASDRGLQQLSELRERHVVWDETSTATGKAFLRSVADDVPGISDGLDEAATAALLARHLDGDR
jgi:hypothetical protein